MSDDYGDRIPERHGVPGDEAHISQDFAYLLRKYGASPESLTFAEEPVTPSERLYGESEDDHLTLSFADCVTAARAVRRAPYGKEALRIARRGGIPVKGKGRAPLSVILYAAQAEGRLVWQGPEGFALLEAPASTMRRNGRIGVKGALAGWVDRHWQLLLLAVPSVLLLVTSLMLASFGGRWSALLLVLATLVSAAVVMSVGLVRMVLDLVFRRKRELARHDGPLGRNWHVPVFHQQADDGVDELLGRAFLRLHYLANPSPAKKVVMEQKSDTPPLVLICLRDGITTPAARHRVAEIRSARIPFDQSGGASVRVFDATPNEVIGRESNYSFLRLYLISVFAMLPGVAYLLMENERQLCMPAQCDGALNDFGRALTWVLRRLIWLDSPDLVPVSPMAAGLWWLLPLIVPAIAAVAFTAVRRAATATSRAAAGEASVSGRSTLMGSTRVLITVTSGVERDAVLGAIEQRTRRVVEARFDQSTPVFAMGALNDVEIFVIQARGGWPADALSIEHAIRHTAPHWILAAGVAYGQQPEVQNLGDLLVSERVVRWDPTAEFSDRQPVDPQGPIEASPVLLHAIRQVQPAWSAVSGAAVHFGVIASHTALVQSWKSIASLRRDFPDVIGSEMEGIGVTAAARVSDRTMVLIKGIAGFGDSVKDEGRSIDVAARNVANFVIHLVLSGVLSYLEPPSTPPSTAGPSAAQL